MIGKWPRKIKKHRRVLILILLAILLLGFSASDPVHQAITGVLESITPIISSHEILGLLLFGLLSAISAIAFFFSTAVIVPVAIHTWGKTSTILLLWVSWLLGAAISYAIGRKPGRRLAKWVVSERKVTTYSKKFSTRASFPLVLLFQLAVPSEIPGYVLGSLRYHFGKYISARAIIELPFAIGAVYLGETFLQRQYLPLVAIASGGILLSVLALYFLHKKME